MTKLLVQFQLHAARQTQLECKKLAAMSDAEDGYRDSMREAFSSQPLMCYFHMKAACRKSLVEKHG